MPVSPNRKRYEVPFAAMCLIGSWVCIGSLRLRRAPVQARRSGRVCCARGMRGCLCLLARAQHTGAMLCGALSGRVNQMRVPHINPSPRPESDRRRAMCAEGWCNRPRRPVALALRCDAARTFSIDLRPERRRSRPPAAHGERPKVATSSIALRWFQCPSALLVPLCGHALHPRWRFGVVVRHSVPSVPSVFSVVNAVPYCPVPSASRSAPVRGHAVEWAPL